MLSAYVLLKNEILFLDIFFDWDLLHVRLLSQEQLRPYKKKEVQKH